MIYWKLPAPPPPTHTHPKEFCKRARIAFAPSPVICLNWHIIACHSGYNKQCPHIIISKTNPEFGLSFSKFAPDFILFYFFSQQAVITLYVYACINVIWQYASTKVFRRSLRSLGVKYIIFVFGSVTFTLLAFNSEIPHQTFSSLASLDRTQNIFGFL